MRILFLLACLALTLLAQSLYGQALRSDERKALLGYLDDSQEALERAIKGLTPEQLAYKPAPDRWSITECIEHLAVVESGILSMVRDQLMKTAPNPEMKPMQPPTDEELLKAIGARETKVKTSAAAEPKGQFGDAKAALKAFEKARDASEAYIKRTPDALHAHYRQGPAGPLDGYQWLVFMAGHTHRHIAQIEEVKADPGFPTAGSAAKAKQAAGSKD